MAYTVSAVGITKAFGNHRALDGVDLAIETGSVLALLGPNGAGKTTMVRILATLVRPDAGTATVAGHDLLADPVGVKRAISLTGQFAAVDDLLTAQENLEMMAQLRHLPRRAARARADELVATFDLVDVRNRRAATYSGGLRRRLDLAISMIERPALLFLDEPTTGLDPAGRNLLWELIASLAARGTTVLLTTQYLEEADRLASRAVVIDHGHVVAEGSPAELKERSGGQVIEVRPLRRDDLPAITRVLAGVTGASVSTERDRVAAPAADPRWLGVVVSRLAEQDIPVSQIGLRLPSLDEAFLRITERSSA